MLNSRIDGIELSIVAGSYNSITMDRSHTVTRTGHLYGIGRFLDRSIINYYITPVAKHEL